MNGFPGLLIALLLPGLLGYAWLLWLWREGHPAARIGYGYLLGILTTVLVMLTWVKSGFRLDFTSLAVILVVLLAFPVIGAAGKKQAIPVVSSSHEFTAGWQRWLWWSLVFLLVIRFGGLVLEEVLRPLYPWDAWMNWAPKAKVWFSLQELVPFLGPGQWRAQQPNADVFTLGNPQAAEYPPLVPVTHLWTALGLDQWRDNWINLPWAFCALAFFLAFYGQLRMLNVSALGSMLAAYLLFSMPCLNTHVALAGYADLWMSAFYTAAAMALFNWGVTRSRAQLCLALSMAVACILAKRPGMAWALTLLPGLVLPLIPAWIRYLLLLALVSIGAILWWNGGIQFQWPGADPIVISPEQIRLPGLGSYQIEYHPVTEYFVKNDLMRDNWHLMGWLMLILLPVAMVRALFNSEMLPSMAVIASGLIFLFVVFFFTSHYRSAMDSTTINRATVHFLPVLFFFLVMVWKEWQKSAVADQHISVGRTHP